MHVRVDRWMRTDEQQLEPLVRQSIDVVCFMEFISHDLQHRLTLRMHLTVPCPIRESIARRGQEPCLWVLGNAIAWPSRERSDERVRESIFSRGNIAGARGEKRNKAPIGLARRGLNRALRLTF